MVYLEYRNERSIESSEESTSEESCPESTSIIPSKGTCNHN